jgi:4-hydroxybenzoate polyprenyltransferase
VLASVAGAYLVAYPYTKRFTWASNLLLGWGLAIAPAAAWIGVRGTLSWEAVVLSLAVAAWAGSFDIIYHVQDVKFYIDNGLHSVAQRFGVRAAFRFASLLDVVAVAALVTTGLLLDLAPPYYAGCLAAVGLLVVKHRLVYPGDLSRMGIAFFRINAFLSAAVFMGTLGAVAID